MNNFTKNTYEICILLNTIYQFYYFNKIIFAKNRNLKL